MGMIKYLHAKPTVVHTKIPRLPEISNDQNRYFFIDTKIHTNMHEIKERIKAAVGTDFDASSKYSSEALED